MNTGTGDGRRNPEAEKECHGGNPVRHAKGPINHLSNESKEDEDQNTRFHARRFSLLMILAGDSLCS